MNESVLDAAVAFVEAVAKGKRMKKREQTVRRLELSMRKAFREQGKLFEKGLRKFKDRYPAPLSPSTETTPQMKEHHFGGEELREALLPTEWMFVFYVVSKETADLFAKPIDRAAAISLQNGLSSALGSAKIGLSFDLSNPRAIKYLQDYGAKLVTKIDETTRDYLQTVITQATEEGWPYKRLAQEIIDRYEEFAVGKPQMHIDSRAHLIAVTETGNAYSEGNLIVAQDLKAAGIEMEKAWSTVGDDKVSEGCLENEAAGWIEVDKAFPSGHLRPLRFPGCRCDLLTRVKEQ